MNTVREYAIQAVLGAIQTTTVIGGCMFYSFPRLHPGPGSALLGAT